MVKDRSHIIEFKRQVAQEYLAGETLHGLSKRHDVSGNLIQIWVEKHETGAFDDDARAADLFQACEARIAALERLVGKRALEREFLKGLCGSNHGREAPPCSWSPDPKPLSVAQECRLMGIPRSTYYYAPKRAADDTALVEAMHGIKDEF
ncbi:MAG: helix-turn-helix domain-containing protein [Pseudomonadota bacterium]